MKFNKSKFFMKVISIVVMMAIVITTCIFQIVNLRKSQAKENIPKASQVSEDNNRNNFSKKLDVDKYSKDIYSGQFKVDDIKETKSIVENLINELKQIIMERSKDNLALYDEYVLLQNKIEENKAVCLLLKLKDKFGGYEIVLDEYLLSIQLNIDLEKYLTNEDDYKKEKDENINKIKNGEIITSSKIEQVYLEKVQQETNNTKNSDKNVEDKSMNNGLSNDMNNNKSKNEKFNNTNDSKVQHPTEDAMREIDDINSRSLNVEGR
ncbi:hypothetical protein [Clostridium cibarium]|uniref:Lipoprotein n=1 Tax=Clostridium cibarium TaxID=2762247 RepID=A0ABR8PVA9_9CLOT|nr:hypothetical protein [Clostridium cibarium]MBD7912107.1 hypothetical protein [Clostridium cibarium]